MNLDQEQYERVSVYGPPVSDDDRFGRFKLESGNGEFKRSALTWISLFFLLVGYPALSIDPTNNTTNILKNLNDGMLIALLIGTILIQWLMFLLLYVSTWRENTLLAGLGFKRLRTVDWAWAISFLLVSMLLLSGLAWFLAKIGLPMPGEISNLIPEDTFGRVIWVLVSFTAGFCEETAFRGYLMTRLRLIFKTKSWLIPAIVSSVVFGACHAYQGWPGFIVITVYGFLFAGLYIRTGTIWPGIIAHTFQDLLALVLPQ